MSDASATVGRVEAARRNDALLAWHLVRPAHADPTAAFSGESARRYGGRWNTPGRPVVNASLHLSLVALETLAHADHRRFERYVTFEVHVPHHLILELRDEDLPDDWRARPVSTGAPRSSRRTSSPARRPARDRARPPSGPDGSRRAACTGCAGPPTAVCDLDHRGGIVRRKRAP